MFKFSQTTDKNKVSKLSRKFENLYKPALFFFDKNRCNIPANLIFVADKTTPKKTFQIHFSGTLDSLLILINLNQRKSGTQPFSETQTLS